MVERETLRGLLAEVEQVASREGILQPGAAYFLGTLAEAVGIGPGETVDDIADRLTVASQPTVDRDNAGGWVHDDGTPCPEYWSDRPTAPGGEPWWCTTHQQHVHVGVDALVKKVIQRVDAMGPDDRPWVYVDASIDVVDGSLEEIVRAVLEAVLPDVHRQYDALIEDLRALRDARVEAGRPEDLALTWLISGRRIADFDPFVVVEGENHA